MIRLNVSLSNLDTKGVDWRSLPVSMVCGCSLVIACVFFLKVFCRVCCFFVIKLFSKRNNTSVYDMNVIVNLKSKFWIFSCTQSLWSGLWLPYLHYFFNFTLFHDLYLRTWIIRVYLYYLTVGWLSAFTLWNRLFISQTQNVDLFVKISPLLTSNFELVLLRSDMLKVVLKLFFANCANNVLRSRLALHELTWCSFNLSKWFDVVMVPWK